MKTSLAAILQMAFPRVCVRVTRIALVLAAASLPMAAPAVNVSFRYRSPRNPERKVRAATRLIVLHTTEAPARSSLNKLSDRGEAHFCVTEEGGVYAIVDRDREAFHAGRSMWTGVEDVDKYSIGIECVGHHDKAMPMAQLTAIRDLVKELKAMYRIPDERVVCHSHVAYGAPNRWQRRRHRGRKRCGMLFAMPSVRRILELKARPAFDPDTRSGRLVVGDEYLQNVLYGRTDTMGTAYPGKPSAAPSSGNWLSRLAGGGANPAASPANPTASPAKPTAPPAKPAAAPAKRSAPPKSIAELKARGYVQKGTVSKTVTASKLAGGKWNASDTYYTIRGKVIPGNAIDAAHIEKGMVVWMKR